MAFLADFCKNDDWFLGAFMAWLKHIDIDLIWCTFDDIYSVLVVLYWNTLAVFADFIKTGWILGTAIAWFTDIDMHLVRCVMYDFYSELIILWQKVWNKAVFPLFANITVFSEPVKLTI